MVWTGLNVYGKDKAQAKKNYLRLTHQTHHRTGVITSVKPLNDWQGWGKTATQLFKVTERVKRHKGILPKDTSLKYIREVK